MAYDDTNEIGRTRGFFSNMLRFATRGSGVRVFGAVGVEYGLNVPLTGETYTVTTDMGGVYFNHTGTIAALTVVLPAGEDGQEINLVFRSAVTTLTITPNGTETVFGKTNPTAGSAQRYRFFKDDTTWRRIDF